MADFTPTSSQAAAIEARGSAVLVSAGAGSGKTRVLTERLMGYLTDEAQPADLDSFLIITFTRAAAGELRSRIMEELAAALAENPGSSRLRRQSALCRRAQIGTIHSFCASLLREHSHLVGLSPDFKIVDEDRARAMKAAALERTLERCYDEPEAHPGFLQLADTVGAGRDDKRLAELVLSLHEKMQCHARPEQWARQQVELLRAGAADVGETPWGAVILAQAGETAAYWRGELERGIREAAADEKMAKAYGPSLAETAEALGELGRCLRLGWDRARACFPIPFPKLGPVKKSPLTEQVKGRRDGCKKAMEKLQERMDAPSEKLLRDMAAAEPAMSALLSLTLDFDREYARDKRRAALADYSDLEHMSARLLTGENGEPSELARQIARRYTEIMVDEYQDVSQVQDTIFQALSRGGKNLFLVGDVKQSIYRFRLADPEIFTHKYETYADEAAPGEPRRILLRENFRSRREILAGANAVFAACMSKTLGDIDYDEAAALKPGAAYEGPGAVPELLLLAAEKGEDEESPDKAALEAAMVAGRIKALMAAGVTVSDHGSQRPLRYGDIAILLRTIRPLGAVYRRELLRQGVPVAAGQGGGYFSAVEISCMLSMLAILDDPHQDIPLIAVLRSPAFGFSADELSRIRAADRQGDFYTALTAHAGEDEKAAAFLRQFDSLRRQAPDLRAAELVWLLLEELDMIALCSAMTDGEQRRARLMQLVALAESFESTGYRGLHRFVLWLRRQAERGQEPAQSAETADAVQILTVHRSKGLEYPVVFFSGTGRKFNLKEAEDTVLVHPKLGLGPKVTDLERRVEYPTLARSAIKLRLRQEALSEEMRLCYVALTRARERLYITAALPEPEAAIEKAAATVTRPMAAEALSQAQAPVNWFISAALADGEEHLRLRVLRPETAQTAQEIEAAPQNADAAAGAELRRRLAFRYPYPAAEALPSKVTATELKGHRAADEEAEALTPRRHRPFRMPDLTKEDRPLTGAEKGTATHLVLQYMDFAKTGDLAQVRGEIERLRAARFLSDREAQAVNAAAILRLFRSPLGQRMLHADAIRREFKFSLLCDAAAVFGQAPGEELLLQGVVDCFLEEAGTLTVIDYKTDALRDRAAAEERARFYSGQLLAYARALERICQKPVRECVLYFLSLGESVTLELAQARQEEETAWKP